MNRAKEIRKVIKDQFGFNSRQVSVRSDHNSVNISIKDLKAYEKMSEIKEAVKKFEHIQRCEYSGEILSGGNSFVFLDSDYEWIDSIASPYIKEVKPLIDEANETEKVLEYKGIKFSVCNHRVKILKNREDTKFVEQKLSSLDDLILQSLIKESKEN